MPTAKEKSDFSARLRFALRKSAQTIKGATDLARLFNLKYRSNRSITVQTAHKWLSGRAIPTADKIEILAEWLGVNPHWLHYGPPPEPIQSKLENTQRAQLKYSPSPETLLLATQIEALPDHQRYLVVELVTHFYGKSPE
ncbi:putative transcriptional regulator [Candidatus Glomeribacter gigasporarum BEG34]|uniref:Putative transcriptional regulator n=1 Tax=Candidatus Glomeribacter gigasporarum BEG34 TaxID=1070319 RepID=G2J7W7_9BURK|nr:transcriptional regulator [Candidatus Glomeribacter gigasporarum]CCD28862.1 putative transcriptional regulator [Candidatus Glomeribacter gigasporarum BEG34]